MKISDKLKNLREENNLTLEELAEKTNIPSSTIADYENGKADPILNDIEKLTAVFNVNHNQLVSRRQNSVNSNKHYKAKQIFSFIYSSCGLLINLLYVVIFFIPMFYTFEYIYPIPEGAIMPEMYYYYYYSLMYNPYFNTINILGIIMFILSLASIAFFIYSFVLLIKKKKNILFSNKLIFVLFYKSYFKTRFMYVRT